MAVRFDVVGVMCAMWLGGHSWWCGWLCGVEGGCVVVSVAVLWSGCVLCDGVAMFCVVGTVVSFVELGLMVVCCVGVGGCVLCGGVDGCVLCGGRAWLCAV